MRRATRLAAWVLLVPSVLLVLVATALYLVLLVTPLPLPFANNAARALVMSTMSPNIDLELGDMALAVEDGAWPVLQFSPVVLSDSQTGARIRMEALEVGFSPLRALVGQPGASIVVVGPQIQLVQDLFGPRATRFELVEDPEGGPATVRVLEGFDSFPAVDITGEGVALDGRIAGAEERGEGERGLRSDNDWLIFNLEASEKGLSDVVEQAAMGRFSRLVVRGGSIGMTDSVYGLYRRFEDVTLDISPNADGTLVEGTFSARVAGRTMTGWLTRRVEADESTTLEADIVNLDFSAVVPFIDDPESMAALRGAGAVSISVGFEAGTGKVESGAFRVDMTGTDIRIKDDFFPVASSILQIAWDPDEALFTMSEGALRIGRSSAYVEGVFALGLDASYGPTLSMSMSARDVVIHPDDMDAPDEPFDRMEFTGWAAPLYGAMGIDRWAAGRADGGVIESSGRIDMLRAGIGFDMSVAGQGVTADDLKRLWPYVMGGESRDWFVANITRGTVARSSMRFSYPVGTVALGAEEPARRAPPGAMQVDIVGVDVAIRPTDEMEPIALDGELVLAMRDGNLSISAGGGVVPTGGGPIAVSRPALVMETPADGPSVVEISGDIGTAIPALIALAEQFDPDALAGADLPVDLEALTGSIDVGVLATIRLEDEEAGTPMQFDYVLNGAIADFASTEPIEGRQLANGQLAFSASNAGYRIAGTAELDGIPADVEIEGTEDNDPTVRLASTVRAAELASMGFDVSDMLSGQVRFVAQPVAGNGLAISIDLREAGLNLADLGIRKPVGVPGTLEARIAQDGELTELSDIALSFGDVRLAGGLSFHQTDGLRAAEFSNVRISPGDNARISLAPVSGGYAVTMRGSQFDLRPMLRRFFSLEDGAGGVGASQFDQALVLDIALDRAIGFYGTTAYNARIDLSVAGDDLRRANVSANFAENNSLSITTNPTPEGRIMSMAFNDAGTILRFLDVYSQMAGGSGSLVLNRNARQDVEAGQLVLTDFAIIDEANVAQILGNHANSRTMIAQRNRLDFDNARVDFVRRQDRIEVAQALLSGELVGGTMRGVIYTDQRQYDLAGTYVPLFGLNNAFQQIPLFGPLLGGRDGEGLVGVTFAVRGPLDDPQFRINPLSALVPGAFRELFEFRTQGEQ